MTAFIIIFIIIVLLLIIFYFVVYKNNLAILENYILENITAITIFSEGGFFVALILGLVVMFFVFLYRFSKIWKIFIIIIFLSSGGNQTNENLTEWEIEFQKEKEKEKEKEKLQRVEEERAFKKNRRERRKRRKIKYETVEYPGEKYHPDYDGIYFFYERFQDAIWRTENTRYFRSKFKIYFPLFLLFVFTFFAWLLSCLCSIDFFIYDADSFYVKVDNQFVYLSKKLIKKKGINFLTVIDWNDQSVNRYLILKNGRFKKFNSFFLTDLHYNWMFQKDVRSKKFPFKFYNWIHRNDNIMICEEKLVHFRKIRRRRKSHPFDNYKESWAFIERIKNAINSQRYGFSEYDYRLKLKKKIINPNRRIYTKEWHEKNLKGEPVRNRMWKEAE